MLAHDSGLGFNAKDQTVPFDSPERPPHHCPRKFMGIIDQNPSVSKSNQLQHVVTFRCFFSNLRYIL